MTKSYSGVGDSAKTHATADYPCRCCLYMRQDCCRGRIGSDRRRNPLARHVQTRGAGALHVLPGLPGGAGLERGGFHAAGCGMKYHSQGLKAGALKSPGAAARVWSVEVSTLPDAG